MIIDNILQNASVYLKLVDTIGVTIESARIRAVQAVNNELLKANWEIGKYIVEFEQNGNEKAEYGSSLLANLSKDLKLRFGKGFSKSNIYLMRQLFIKYPIFQSLTGNLIQSMIDLINLLMNISLLLSKVNSVNLLFSCIMHLLINQLELQHDSAECNSSI